MYGYRARIAYTSPLSVTEVFPYEFYLMAPEGVTLMLSTMAVRRANEEEVGQSWEMTIKASKEMARAGATVLVHGGVPINMSQGEGALRNLVRVTEAECGIPATSSFDAQTSALRAVGARKVAMIGMRPQSQDHAVSVVAAAGADVIGFQELGIDDFHRLANLPVTRSADLARALLREHKDADTIYFPGPHYPVAANIETLEMELSVQVIAASQAILWEALRKSNVYDSVSGFGKLMREF